jgi:predicted amidohydrolase YtcJ
MTADLLIHGGTIRTMDPARPLVEALAVADGRVTAADALSEVAPLAGPGTRRVDLAGGTLVPGFNDAHVHVWKIGQLLTSVIDLRGSTSLSDIDRRVRDKAAQAGPGAWVVGRGWNEAALREGTGPDRAFLDTAAPRNPVVLTRTCAHIHAVNTSALRRAGVDEATAAPSGGRLDLARGLLYETAWGLVQRAIPAPTPADYEEWILAGARYLGSLGITSATDAAVDPPLYAAYRRLDDEGRLPLRVNLLHLLKPDLGGEPYPLPSPVRGPRLRCDTVKLFADGGLSGSTAAVSLPYRGQPEDRGLLRFETGELHALARTARRAGYRLAVHAIGDRALDQVLEVYGRLAHEEPDGPPHRIEHFGIALPRHLEAARALRVQVVTQPAFVRELAGNFRRSLPGPLLDRCYPFRAMIEAGLTVAFSSDGPVVHDVSPLAGMAAAALDTLDPVQRVEVADALAAYTTAGAIVQGDEDNRGRLRPGFWADAVVLDRDPLGVPPAELSRLQVQTRFVGQSARGES